MALAFPTALAKVAAGVWQVSRVTLVSLLSAAHSLLGRLGRFSANSEIYICLSKSVYISIYSDIYLYIDI